MIQRILYMLYMIKVKLLYWYCYMFPDKGTYKDILCYKKVFGASKYVKARNKIFHKAKQNIQKKDKKSIRILMIDCCGWCTQGIYNYFSNKDIDIAVIIAPFFHGTEESIKKAYNACREFCVSKQLRFFEIYDSTDWTFISNNWKDARGDVLIYTNPWMGSYPKEIKINNIPLSSITCYIPYGFMLMKGESHQFNQGSHNMFTYIYCESETHIKMFDQYCDIGSSHVEFSGHPKMDYYMDVKYISEKSIWNGLDQNTEKVKIIYSPHWNFDAGYATFLDNGLKILEYAESHQETTSWVYKPHPLLEQELIVKEYMSAEEYLAYIKRWEKLPNAKVYLSGDYGNIFTTSDCIINDSISFIAEYMYTHKPMLLLQNNNVQYNVFGKECVKNVYRCKGNDIEGIIQFIEDVYCGKDEMKESREKFFNENLNYLRKNNQLASDYIVSKISDIIYV